MSDVFSVEKRSRIMSRIGPRDTELEKLVRSLLHNGGFRFRLHRRDLPGSPDIVLPKYETVVFVHGCFWHGHDDCPRAARPTSNVDFWNDKLDANQERDERVTRKLEDLGWHVVVVWECETKKPLKLLERLCDELEFRGSG